MPRYKFPPSVPRKMYWSERAADHMYCPDCGGPLQREQHSYVLATKHRGHTEFFIAGTDDGYFCARCPVVVLDREGFARFAAIGVRSADDLKFVVLGIVDLEAVPEDKRHLPFDEKTNPVPLVRFTNVPGPNGSSPADRVRTRKRILKMRRKRKRS